jgi:hypothetical protein
VNWYS